MGMTRSLLLSIWNSIYRYACVQAKCIRISFLHFFEGRPAKGAGNVLSYTVLYLFRIQRLTCLL
jgi:hypothetical protein